MKILLYWAMLSFLGVIIIKTIIRPNHFQLSNTFNFLQETLPNFFAGSGVFVIAFVYYKAFYINKNSITKRIIVAFASSFLGLTTWEFIPYYMGFSIDYYDVLMTGLGNLVSILIIVLLRLK